MKQLTILLLFLTTFCVSGFAQATKDFEMVEFVKWSDTRTEFSAIIIVNPEPDPYKLKKATVRVSFTDTEDQNSGVYEYDAYLTINHYGSTNNFCIVRPAGRDTYNPDAKIKMLKGNGDYVKVKTLSLDYDQNWEFLKGDAAHDQYSSLEVRNIDFYNAEELISAIKHFYSEKDVLYNELILYAYYLEHINSTEK